MDEFESYEATARSIRPVSEIEVDLRTNTDQQNRLTEKLQALENDLNRSKEDRLNLIKTGEVPRSTGIIETEGEIGGVNEVLESLQKEESALFDELEISRLYHNDVAEFKKLAESYLKTIKEIEEIFKVIREKAQSIPPLLESIEANRCFIHFAPIRNFLKDRGFSVAAFIQDGKIMPLDGAMALDFIEQLRRLPIRLSEEDPPGAGFLWRDFVDHLFSRSRSLRS